MTTKCEQLDDLLFDGSALAMETAARHAAECAACAETLAAWNEISDTASSMRATWPTDMLWPRIERALRQEKKRSMPRWIWRAAAMLLITVGLGATVFYIVRESAHEAEYNTKLIQSAALDDVERAERAHIDAIANLEKLAESRLDDAEAPVMIAYKEKLMLLDDAIAECEANIDTNRQNAHLRKQLLAMYTEKQQTLGDVLREDLNVSTP
jgi:hypothetical protein